MFILILTVLILCIFFLGASVFSFLNVVAWRLPRHMNFMTGRSICPSCGHTLSAMDLIPVFGYLLRRGRCHYCHAKISSRHVWTELLGGLAAVAVFAVYPLNPLLALTVFSFLSLLFLITVVDGQTMEIPNGFTVAVLIAGLICGVVFPQIGWLDRLIGAFCVSVPLLLITLLVPGAFGGGDIKLMAAGGVFLGWKLCLTAGFLAILAGGAYGGWLLVTKRASKGAHFAFGPFLCAGMLLAWFFGDSLIQWYISLF